MSHILLAALLLTAGHTAFAEGGHGDGTDVEIGGPGSGYGKFSELKDITFDAQNQLYVLDGGMFYNGPKDIGRTGSVVSGLFFDQPGPGTGATSNKTGSKPIGVKAKPIKPAAVANLASFAGTDGQTQGSWKGKYGADGYTIVAAGSKLPDYAVVQTKGNSSYAWYGTTADVRGLFKSATATDRIASTWYNPTFIIDVNLTDGKMHCLSFYCVDWENPGPSGQKVEVLDATSGAVLDTQTLTGIGKGKYTSWNLQGHVTLRLTGLASVNALASGLFFDPPKAMAAPANPGSARFVRVDEQTQGNWKGAYGAQGYQIPLDGASTPSYAQLKMTGQNPQGLAWSTTDPRALQLSSATKRQAAWWNQTGEFLMDINLTDGQAHQISLYCLDWNHLNRFQTLEVFDAETGKLLDTQSASLMSRGKYYVWNIQGHVVIRVTPGGWVGNFLVQKFDNNGNFLKQFSIFDASLGTNNAPRHIAADSQGNIYVTQPRAGLVQQYDPNGTLLKSISIPNASAIHVQKWNGAERILVIPGWVEPDGPIVTATRIETLDTAGNRGAPIVLSNKVQMVGDLATDSKGNLFVLGSTDFLAGKSNQIFKFDANGKLLATLGSGTMMQVEDGSELTRSVAIDRQDNIYSLTFGQPYNVVRYSADLQTVTARPGQFYWYEGWSRNNDNTPLTLDKNDRIWVGVPGDDDGTTRWHFRPCVLRTAANFLSTDQPGVTTNKTYALGLSTSLDTKLPFNVSNTLGAQSFDFVVKAAYRQVSNLNVAYRIYDVYKNLAASGKFSLNLQNYVEARKSIPFTPSKWGWYTCEFFMTDNSGRDLGAVGAHLGFTPTFANMPLMTDGDSAGGFNDSLRQAFCGLMLERVDLNGGPANVEKAVNQAGRYGTTLIVQFQGLDTATPEIVQAAVTQFKGRVKYWEILNEPNNGMSAAQYVALLKKLYPIIKQIDPAAQVLGPTVVGIDLNWLKAFYTAGGQPYFDILSLHDYEGDESIDPGHWVWKLNQLRGLMTTYGDARKEIWQTERAITGIRFNTFLGGCQAARVTLHNDILEMMGVAPDHNLHYYLNDVGYSPVPSYLWSWVGPHPGALTMRTRRAMTLGRKFAGNYDFGPTGNKIFLGMLYTGGDGSTVLLRNFGTSDQSLTVRVVGGSVLQVVDSFGNIQKLPVVNGKVTLTVPILPIYLRLDPGQDIAIPKIDFGKNLATDAAFVYSDKTQSDPKLLVDGVLGNTHAGDPNQFQIWKGQINTSNPTLEIDFPSTRTVSKMLVFSVRADNPHCTLLDYDLQAFNGRGWVTIDRVRTPCPTSDVVKLPKTAANGWYMDNNFTVHQFAPVTTTKMRIVVLRVTYGQLPDSIANDACKALYGWGNTNVLELREIEIY